MRIGEHADWSAKIYTVNRNHSKRSGLQFSIYRPLRNEGNPEALFERRLDCIDMVDLQSKFPVWPLLKNPPLGESSRGRFGLTNNESLLTELIEAYGRTGRKRMIPLDRVSPLVGMAGMR